MKILLAIFILLFPFYVCLADNLIDSHARDYREEGYRLQSMGDLRGAMMYYQKAAQMDPHFAEVRNDLGVVYEALGDPDNALAMYKQVLEIQPGYLPAYTNLAFIYEKKGDIKNATLYWKKRYELGQEGDYWWEVSRQHLLKLGTYPQVRKEIMEEKAARLSREYIYKREQERLKIVEEAQLHFDIGDKAFKERDYEIARKEFRTVISLNPPDKDLIDKAQKFYQEADRLYLREQAYTNTKDALDYMNKGDYLSAGGKLKDALTAVFSVTREE